MATESITTCPICNHSNFNHCYSVKDHSISGETFELKRCEQCNFIITSPRPDKTSIEKYYASENYISHSGISKSFYDKIYLTARNITLHWKHRLIDQYFPNPSKLLDYGCGTGDFLKHMKNRGWNIIGIEPAQIARQKANQILDYKVSEDLETINVSKVNLITLWHVLEHIHDLNTTIQKLKSLLTPDGLIIIAVPNCKSHDCQHYKENWAAYDVPRHLWHFSQETMSTFLKNNGLKVVATKPMKLDSFYVSILSEGYQNPNQLTVVKGLKSLFEGLTSNLKAINSTEYSSLIFLVKPE